MEEQLPISEKLYLLTIHPKKGGIISGAFQSLDYVLLGALFLELWMNKNIEFENKRIVVKSSKSKNKLHIFLLNKLRKKERPLKVSRWINKLYFFRGHIRREVQKSLVNRRIIKMENKKFLFFRWRKSVLLNKSVVYKLVDQIQKQVTSGQVNNEEDVLLLSMLKPAGLISRIFPEKTRRKKAKSQLKQIMTENEISRSVSNAIAASQAVAASVAATSATAATTGS